MMRLRTAAAGGLLVAAAAVLAPAPAFAQEGDSWVDGDRYARVLYDRDFPGYGSIEWKAECPPTFPWLDRLAGSDGRRVGQGLQVTEDGSGISVQEAFLGAGRTGERTPDGRMGITGNRGDAWSISPDAHALRLVMVCTRAPADAWVP